MKLTDDQRRHLGGFQGGRVRTRPPWLRPVYWRPRYDVNPLEHRLTAAAAIQEEAYNLDPSRLEAAGWRVHVIEGHESEGLILSDGLGTVIWVCNGTESFTDIRADIAHLWRIRPDWTPPGMRFAAGSIRVVNRLRPMIARHHVYGKIRPGETKSNDVRFFCIGHSMGAGAVLVAIPALIKLGIKPREVFAFEPPRIASGWTPRWSWFFREWRAMPTTSARWHRAECASHGVKAYRVVTTRNGDRDPVTLVPLTELGAADAGELVLNELYACDYVSDVTEGAVAHDRLTANRIRLDIQGKTGHLRRLLPTTFRFLGGLKGHGIAGIAAGLAARHTRKDQA